MTFDSWITRALALTLAVPTVACDPGGDDLDAAQDTDAEEEEEAEDDGDELRTLPCFFLAPTSADVSSNLLGVVQYITRQGSGTGNGCDLFTLDVATPSGNRATEVTFGGIYNAPVDAVARVWARSCTSGEFPLCTTWTSIPVTLDAGGFCGSPDKNTPWHCSGHVSGVATLDPDNSYTQVRAGIRVEDGNGTSRTATITISE